MQDGGHAVGQWRGGNDHKDFLAHLQKIIIFEILVPPSVSGSIEHKATGLSQGLTDDTNDRLAD